MSDQALIDMQRQIDTLSTLVNANSSSTFAETSTLKANKDAIASLKDEVSVLRAELKSTNALLSQFASKSDVSRDIRKMTEALAEALTSEIVASERQTASEVKVDVEKALTALSLKTDKAVASAQGTAKSAENLLRAHALNLNL